MTRLTTAGQLATSSKNIFITTIQQADGTTKPVMSAHPLSKQSIRVNRTWQGERWEGENYITGPCTNNGALFLLMTLCAQGDIFYYNESANLHNARFLCADVLKHMLGYLFPVSENHQVESLGNYAVAVRRPPSIFQQIEMDPFVVVDAAMRGQEDIVLNILRADPSYLLKKAKVNNSVDAEHEVTPLQAAIMANDVQLIECMKKHFERLTTDLAGNPIDGLAEMQQQIIAIYKESLKAYFRKREMKELTTSGTVIDDAAESSIQAKFEAYWQTVQQCGINAIIEEHNRVQAQNIFDFKPYIDAICNIDLNNPLQKQQLHDAMALINAATTPEKMAKVIARTGVSATQTDEARAKPFDQLTLVEKLNRFREEFVAHMKQEVIFNPNHILESLRQNDQVWDEVDAGRGRVADPNYHKRTMIFSQFVGWTQRTSAEPVKQDIRQGTWCLTEKNERCTRQSYFNRAGRNHYPDVSLINSSVVDGIGYKFAVAGVVADIGRGVAQHFSKLMSNKNSTLSELVTRLARTCTRKSERQCIVM